MSRGTQRLGDAMPQHHAVFTVHRDSEFGPCPCDRIHVQSDLLDYSEFVFVGAVSLSRNVESAAPVTLLSNFKMSDP
jgi:hypothetical protein